MEQFIYDFSSPELRGKFTKQLQDPMTWGEPLPNLEWISHTEFVKAGFFLFTDWVVFIRVFGGHDRLSNNDQFPDGYGSDKRNKNYAKCFILPDMCGYVLLPDRRYKPTDKKEMPYALWKGKLFVAKFWFCKHRMITVNKRRCLNEHTCSKCGFKLEVDSS